MPPRTVPKRLLSRSSAAITSSGMVPHSNSSRPISVDLPSSTEPQVSTRSREFGHQKYPSRFFFSIEASWSWSISRPARSDTRVVRISATISSRLAAADSTAADSG